MIRPLLAVMPAVFLVALMPLASAAQDLTGMARRAVEKSTLDQPGTHPFHLKATYSPSFDRDKETHREGTVEFWWQSPTQWRREVSAPGFHQVEIVNGSAIWQKNDGDYLPLWLDQLATAIVRPVPFSNDDLVKRIRSGEQKALAMQVNFDWKAQPGPGAVNGRGYLAVYPKNEMLFYAGGLGWGGDYQDFHDFHGRQIAFTVTSGGDPELTAKIMLEDLPTEPAEFFNATAPGGDAHPILTTVADETELQRSVEQVKAPAWPPVENGPFEGVVWTEVCLDRDGKVRDMLKPVSDNPALIPAADAYFRSVQFPPVLRNGMPVEAVGRIQIRFKTTRPAGMENFATAKQYFEKGEKTSYPWGLANEPYLLRAEFQTGDGKGGVQTGRYEDTWISDTAWRREAWLGDSHFVRARTGSTYYRDSNGPSAALLGVILQAVEPIPARDTMTESDWRIKRDNVDGRSVIRVFRGPEGPNGELDPGRSNGYWFTDGGVLVRSYVNGLEIRPAGQIAFQGRTVPRQFQVMKDGKTGLIINVTEIVTPPTGAEKTLTVKGHEWKRAFTSEAR